MGIETSETKNKIFMKIRRLEVKEERLVEEIEEMKLSTLKLD